MFVVCECMDSVMHAKIMVKETILWVWKLNSQLTLLQQRNKEIMLFSWWTGLVVRCSRTAI